MMSSCLLRVGCRLAPRVSGARTPQAARRSARRGRAVNEPGPFRRRALFGRPTSQALSTTRWTVVGLTASTSASILMRVSRRHPSRKRTRATSSSASFRRGYARCRASTPRRRSFALPSRCLHSKYARAGFEPPDDALLRQFRLLARSGDPGTRALPSASRGGTRRPLAAPGPLLQLLVLGHQLRDCRVLREPRLLRLVHRLEFPPCVALVFRERRRIGRRTRSAGRRRA